MSRKGSMPRYYGKNIAQHAQRRYLRSRETETKRLEQKWKFTAEIVGSSVLLALEKDFGMEVATLQGVAARAGAVAEAFNTRKKVAGWNKAKIWLNDEVKAYFEGDFMLPVVPTPKTKKEWGEFSIQRSIADNIIKFYAKALFDGGEFGPEKIEAFAKAAERAYLQLMETKQEEGGD